MSRLCSRACPLLLRALGAEGSLCLLSPPVGCLALQSPDLLEGGTGLRHPGTGRGGVQGLGAPRGSVHAGAVIWLEQSGVGLPVEGLRGRHAGMENASLGPCGGDRGPCQGAWQLGRGQDPSVRGESSQLSLHLLEVRARCHHAPSCACGSCGQQDRVAPACEPPPLISLLVSIWHGVDRVLL